MQNSAGLKARKDAGSSAKRAAAESACARKAEPAIPARHKSYRERWEVLGKSYAERLARAFKQARVHDRAWLFDMDGTAYVFATPDKRILRIPKEQR